MCTVRKYSELKIRLFFWPYPELFEFLFLSIRFNVMIHLGLQVLRLQFCMQLSSLSWVLHVLSCPYHSYSFRYPDNIRWRQQIIKLIIINIFNLRPTSSLLVPNIFLSALIWSIFNVCSFLVLGDQFLTHTKQMDLENEENNFPHIFLHNFLWIFLCIWNKFCIILKSEIFCLLERSATPSASHFGGEDGDGWWWWWKTTIDNRPLRK